LQKQVPGTCLKVFVRVAGRSTGGIAGPSPRPVIGLSFGCKPLELSNLLHGLGGQMILDQSRSIVDSLRPMSEPLLNRPFSRR
jgi:hypothetical protein